SGACATKPATSSLEIITLRGAYQAEIKLLPMPALSMAATVAESGSSVCGASAPLVHRRSESKIGSCKCRAVGCWAQASMIIELISAALLALRFGISAELALEARHGRRESAVVRRLRHAGRLARRGCARGRGGAQAARLCARLAGLGGCLARRISGR